MQAMLLNNPGELLVLTNLPDPQPSAGEVRVRVGACGVCRTELHVVDGELPNPKLPIVPGHEIVGRVDALGAGVEGLSIGARVGIPWLGWTCGRCRYCSEGRENLCDVPLFTGYTRDGGYATHVVADARFVFALPPEGDDVGTAPLLCAGLIGWRSLRIAGEGQRIGLYGFGAAAHIIAQVARWQGPRRLRVHQGRRCCGSALRPYARGVLGRRIGRDPARAPRLCDHLRPGRRTGAGRAQGGAQGRPRGLAPAFT
jgi:propanol-preferring alcohol dehydrogenase